MAKKRKLKRSIFIACEGSNTEPLYFEKLKEVMEDDDYYPFAITIYPDREFDENPKTDAVGLVNVAMERREEFDEVWVVFDKDGYTKHKEVFKLAETHKVNIAFSSISFETWVLLHFERSNAPFKKSANIIDDKFHNNESYLINYAKSGDYNVYPILKDKINQAFENAAWLRDWLHSISTTYTIYEVNPFTNVDLLVKKLILDDSIYECRLLNQSVSFNGVELIVRNTDNVYVVEIKNSTQRSLVLNEFSFHDHNKKRIALANKVISEGHRIKVDLVPLDTSDRIFIEFENLRVEVSSKEAYS